eukprot:Gregarina_sp_Pseudo_9__1810@NODE_222_length_3540_cov_142_790917_g89_i1_p1_GENE_NODE_222_length_3540_cov_142_790917_g89_i1NODE_222_length_3540_cov_142_790917_g89_i1_p1_ORF_typecomplete_len302_score68_53TMEM173/PF15009_6/0_33_NODE_222_length_3540_cov_142_790917_g89_i143948
MCERCVCVQRREESKTKTKRNRARSGAFAPCVSGCRVSVCVCVCVCVYVCVCVGSKPSRQPLFLSQMFISVWLALSGLLGVWQCANGWRVSDFSTANIADCWPAECAAVAELGTWEAVVDCRGTAPTGCFFSGKFVYEDELLPNFEVQRWQEDKVIISIETPLKPSEELQGYLRLTNVNVELAFEPPLQGNGEQQCLYFLGPTAATAPTLVPPALDPSYVCGSNGFPPEFRVTDTLEVLFRSSRMSYPYNFLYLEDCPLVAGKIIVLIDPIEVGATLVNVTIRNYADFTVESRTGLATPFL